MAVLDREVSLNTPKCPQCGSQMAVREISQDQFVAAGNAPCECPCRFFRCNACGHTFRTELFDLGKKTRSW